MTHMIVFTSVNRTSIGLGGQRTTNDIYSGQIIFDSDASNVKIRGAGNAAGGRGVHIDG